MKWGRLEEEEEEENEEELEYENATRKSHFQAALELQKNETHRKYPATTTMDMHCSSIKDVIIQIVIQC